KDIKTLPLEYKNGMLVAEAPLDKMDARYAYDFNLAGKRKVTLTEMVNRNNQDYALSMDPKSVVFDRPHQIYHVVPDSFAPKDKSEIYDDNGNIVWRNHFDKYGGNLKGIIENLDYIKDLGTARIMGTPIFGDDSISCHGYWTQNPYQIASTMGDLNDFDNLNVKLFQKGMGWIADGAFVNQGLMGVQIQDLLRRSLNDHDESPFKDWFTLYQDIGPEFSLGVLPQDGNGKILHDNYHISFCNAPVDKMGNENPDYDESKPTYLTLSDPRNRNSSGVRKSFDSVQNYRFPVDPQEVANKINFAVNFAEDGSVAKTEFLEWSNFSLTGSDDESGKLLWDGNRDVLKMNMENPEVRKYIMDAGKYWTTRVDNKLQTFVSTKINEVLADKKLKPSAENIKLAIETLEQNGVFPQGASDLKLADIDNAMSEPDKAITYTSLRAAIKDFPVASIELGMEISAIVTNPAFEAKYKEICDSPAFSNVVNRIIESSNISQENREKFAKPEIYKLFSQDIAKAIMTKAITGVDYIPGQDISENWQAKLSMEAEKYLPLQIFEASSDSAVNLLSNKIKLDGLENINVDEIAKSINTTLTNLDVPTVKVAKELLTTLESGLDWRIDAAKDVADMDAVRNGRLTKQEAVDFMTNFWSEFCKEVRTINPKAYIIGEVTDLADNELPQFLTADKFSTLSDYRYMFGTPYKFVHAHPEVMGWHDGPKALSTELNNFVKSWPISAVNTAHNMVDNHDKSRVLHNLLVHPGDFNKSPQDAMINLLRYALCKVYGVDKTTNTVEKFKNSDQIFAKVFDGIKNTSDSVGQDFGYWPIVRGIEQVFKDAKIENKDLMNKMLRVLFDDATNKYIRMLYLMVGAPGAPEIYAGTEMGMTGGETVSKNVYNQNRNPLFWMWLDEKDGRPEVRDFNKKVSSIFSLRNNKNLSALNNGFMKNLNYENEKAGILAFMRYNDNQQAVVILNNGNVDEKSNAADAVKGDLSGNLAVKDSSHKHIDLFLTHHGIDIGAEFINAEKPDDKYIVWNDGKLRSKPADVNSVDDINRYQGELPATVSVGQGKILYRNLVQDQPKPVSFKGLNRIV
ncbi:MAG: alpha-amylase family glycosyl hydrolase, partial [Vampirovibrionia bacterium]